MVKTGKGMGITQCHTTAEQQTQPTHRSNSLQPTWSDWQGNRTLLPFLTDNSTLWVTALLDHLLWGMYSLVTFVPLYWQSSTFFWNNHMSIRWWQLSTPKSHMSQQKLLCHWIETDSILLMGCWPQLSRHPRTIRQPWPLLSFCGRAGFREQGLKRTTSIGTE